MRDGINIARKDTPAIALVTSDFWSQGNFVARASGMPDVPRVELPHPVAGSGEQNMQRVAEGIVDKLLLAFDGSLKGEVRWSAA